MPEDRNISHNEHCPRCGTLFVCKPYDVGHCNCNQVVISRQEYDYISARFAECLCNNCLEDMKREYHAKDGHKI